MQTFYFPAEDEFRRWIRESIKIELEENQSSFKTLVKTEDEPLLSRHDMARDLDISLVTLTDWCKKGLPYLRINGRVYFRRAEVINSMFHNKAKKASNGK